MDFWSLLWVAASIGGLYFAFSAYQESRWLRYADGKIIPKVAAFKVGEKINTKKIFDTVLRWHRESGPTFQFWFLNRPMLSVSKVASIRKILEDPNMDQRLSFWPMEQEFGGKGMVFSTSQTHHRLHRALALKGLMKTNILRNTTKVVQDKLKLLLKDIDNAANAQGETTMEVAKKIHTLALDVIATAGFSLEFNAYEGKQDGLAYAMHEMLIRPIEFVVYPKFVADLGLLGKPYKAWKQNAQTCKTLLLKIISDRRNSTAPPRHDYLQELLEAVDPNTLKSLPDEDLFVDLVEIFFAGHETTSFTTQLACHALSFSPEWQEKLQKECDQFGEYPEYEDYQKMRICHAVVKETLRIWPASFNTARVAINDTSVEGITIPKGTTVAVNFIEAMRSAENFKNPLQFDPSRWLETIDSEEKAERPEDLAWMPFGAGHRSCVGVRMALLEAKVILHSIFSRYNVSPVSEKELLLSTIADPTMRPETPLSLKFQKRK